MKVKCKVAHWMFENLQDYDCRLCSDGTYVFIVNEKEFVLSKKEFGRYFEKVEEKVMFKVGDIVEWSENKIDKEIGKTYIVLDSIHSDKGYKILIKGNENPDIEDWYFSKYFCLVTPLPDTIKISKWEELDGVVSVNYIVKCNNNIGSRIQIRTTIDSQYVGDILFCTAPKETILAWLKLFGFNVQFTPEHTLTDREYGCCLMYESGWVAQDKDAGLWWHENIPKANGRSYSSVSGELSRLPSDIFPWITFETGAAAIEDLKKLKRLGVE